MRPRWHRILWIRPQWTLIKAGCRWRWGHLDLHHHRWWVEQESLLAQIRKGSCTRMSWEQVISMISNSRTTWWTKLSIRPLLGLSWALKTLSAAPTQSSNPLNNLNPVVSVTLLSTVLAIPPVVVQWGVYTSRSKTSWSRPSSSRISKDSNNRTMRSSLRPRLPTTDQESTTIRARTAREDLRWASLTLRSATYPQWHSNRTLFSITIITPSLHHQHRDNNRIWLRSGSLKVRTTTKTIMRRRRTIKTISKGYWT